MTGADTARLMLLMLALGFLIFSAVQGLWLMFVVLAVALAGYALLVSFASRRRR